MYEGAMHFSKQSRKPELNHTDLDNYVLATIHRLKRQTILKT